MPKIFFDTTTIWDLNIVSLSINQNDKEITKLPLSIFSLKNLELLSINSNALINIPKEIGELENLRSLTIISRNLKSLPKSIGNLKNLSKLWISDAVNMDSLPMEIGNIKHIRVLNFNNVKKIPKLNETVKNIAEIYIYYADDLSGVTNYLGGAYKLRIRMCSIDSLPIIFDHSTHLEEIAIDDCKNLKHIASSNNTPQKLRSVKITNTSLGEIPSEILLATGLKYFQFSKDSKHILSTTKQRSVNLWDVEKGEIVKEMKTETWCIESVFLNNESQVLTSSTDKPVEIWDVKIAKLLHTMEENTMNANYLVLNAKGDKLLARIGEKKVVLINIKSGKVIHEFKGHTGIINCVNFSPNEKELVTGSWDKTAKTWDLKTGKVKQTFTGHSHYVYDANLNKDGTKLITASSDGLSILWDAKNGSILHEYGPFGKWTHNNTSFFTPDDQNVMIATIGGGMGQAIGKLQLWNVESFELEQDFEEAPLGSSRVILDKKGVYAFSTHGNQVNQWDLKSGRRIREYKGNVMANKVMDISMDGKKIAFTCDRSEIRILDLTTGETKLSYSKTKLSVLNDRKFEEVRFTPDGNQLAAKFIQANELQLKNSSNVREGSIHLRGHEKDIFGFDFDAKNKMIATVSKDKTAKIWSRENGELLATLVGHENSVWNPAFSPSGKHLLTMGWDKRAILWDTKTGENLFEFEVYEYNHSKPLFTPDEKYLLYEQRGQMALVDMETKKEVRTYKGEITSPLIEKERFAMNFERHLYVHNIYNPDRVDTIPHTALRAIDIKIHPKGESVLMIDNDFVLYHYAIPTGDLISTTKEIKERSNSVIFHPSGDFYISSDLNSNLTFWSSKTGEKLLTYISLEDEDWLAMTPSGKYDGTPGAFSKLYYSIDNQTVLLQDLYETNYEKGLINKVFALK